MDGWMGEWVDGWMGGWSGWMDGTRRRAERPDKNEEVVDVVQSRRTWKSPEMSAEGTLELKLHVWDLRREEEAQLNNQDVRCPLFSTNSTVTAPDDCLGQPCMRTIMLGRSLFIEQFCKKNWSCQLWWYGWSNNSNYWLSLLSWLKHFCFTMFRVFWQCLNAVMWLGQPGS